MNTFSELPRLNGAYDPDTLSLTANHHGYRYLIRQRGSQYIVYIFGRAARETVVSAAETFPKNALESLNVSEDIDYLRLAFNRVCFLQEDLVLLQAAIERVTSLCITPTAFTPPPEDEITKTAESKPNPFFVKPNRRSFAGAAACAGVSVALLLLAVALQTVNRTVLPYLSAAISPVCLLLTYHRIAQKLDVSGAIAVFALNFAVVAFTAPAFALLLSLIIFAAGIILYFYRNGLFLYEDKD
jgi:hypothetical protein